MEETFSRRQMMQAATALPLAAAAIPAMAADRTARSRLDPAKIAAIPAALQPFIDRGDVAGIVTLTWQHGRVAQVETLGWRDSATHAPMRRDTLFRIASMSKPITSVAVLMLVEDGKLRLSDPVSRWIPELANRRVLRDAAGPLDDTVPARREITIEDLLTHRSGLAYGLFSTGPIARAYDAAIGSAFDHSRTVDQWLAGLGTLPLSYQPGERMHYSVSTDVLGCLVERIAGRPFRDVLQTRIFGPLGMVDTDTWVPPAKRDRLATLYQFDQARDALVAIPGPDIYDRPPPFSSGGAGLISTADDYLAFARMLLGDGRLGRVRLLRPATVRDMRTDRLTPAQRRIPFISRPVWDGMGFGLGLGIVDVPEKSLLGNGRPGSFGWPGAYGTWWQADPVEDLIMVYMIQHYYELSPNSGALIAGGRGVAARGALPIFQRMTYEALG